MAAPSPSAPSQLSPSPGKRAITHEDLWLMKRVGAPTVSPDGKWAVLSVTEPSYDDKAQISDLWIVSTDTQNPSPPRRLTGTSGGESGVDWSPDGRRLVFSAKREGDETGQLYLLDLQARITDAVRSIECGPLVLSLPVVAGCAPCLLYTSPSPRD
ncbi:MAG: hypothetical protein EBV76_11640, partial [Gammaproteobacteria bacterium]|nr:hypothetical protein [Gammaproteobacteria bacterium]